MYAIDQSMTAEIQYRQSRVALGLAPRRRRIKAFARPGRRLTAGSRARGAGLSGVGGTVAAAR